MAATTTTSTANRQSFLTLDPVKFSLTDGTNIPPPEDTPPSTSNGLKTTTGGVDAKTAQQTNDDAPQDLNNTSQTHSERKPGPPSVLSNSTSPQRHGMRRLFSLGSLRSSFSGSRASLSLPQESAHRSDVADASKPPSSPSVSHKSATTTSPKQGKLRKNDSWFKRKSGMLWSNGDKPLASIGEDGRPESKRAREHSPAPLLPDIKSLAGGDLKDGEVEWDDRQFKRPA